jgi:hypothetical protein
MVVKLPTTILGLVTRHNFHASRIEYAIDIVILGKKFTIPVTDDFVSRLDSVLEADSAPLDNTPAPQPTNQENLFEQDAIPPGYSLGSLERDPDDYSYEEIEKL